ncbi:hypothetical protein HYDPIDRAFT_26747 [Hydnomerulius pinastri MD-312]|nr:hypothetical protein HYDPIDRAFT_26747 [Hydnomerulius pinastri MD-312]
MSLTPPGAALVSELELFGYVQIAVTTAAIYDHALTFGREVELIWKKPPSLVMVFYIVDRYLGDAVLLAGSYCEGSSLRRPYFRANGTCSMFYGVNVGKCEQSILLCKNCSVLTGSRSVGLRLFQFRAWGTLAYSWATQAIMQLRIYAMYRRSKTILALLLVFFVCEIAAIAFIIWRAIGPSSPLTVTNNYFPEKHYCAFSGVNGSFTYLFIPVLCFEAFLFFLAARVFLQTFRSTSEVPGTKGLRVNSFMSVLARDSLFYFFVNLATCAVVMGLWQSVTALYANICVPFVMLLEVLVGTRLVINFRERYARSDRGPIVSGRHSSLHFRGDDVQMDTLHISVRYDVETLVVSDGEKE